MKTLRQHLRAMSELQTAEEYADYLFRHPESDGMELALLEYVPAGLLESTGDALASRYMEEIHRLLPYRGGIDNDRGRHE